MTNPCPLKSKGQGFFVSILLQCSYFPEIQATGSSLNFLCLFLKEHPPRRTRQQTIKSLVPQNSHTHLPPPPRGFSRGRIPLNQEGVMGFQGDLGGRLAYPWSLWPQRAAENSLTQNQKTFRPTIPPSELPLCPAERKSPNSEPDNIPSNHSPLRTSSPNPALPHHQPCLSLTLPIPRQNQFQNLQNLLLRNPALAPHAG